MIPFIKMSRNGHLRKKEADQWLSRNKRLELEINSHRYKRSINILGDRNVLQLECDAQLHKFKNIIELHTYKDKFPNMLIILQ